MSMEALKLDELDLVQGQKHHEFHRNLFKMHIEKYGNQVLSKEYLSQKGGHVIVLTWFELCLKLMVNLVLSMFYNVIFIIFI